MPHYAPRYRRTLPHYYEDSDECPVCDGCGYADDCLPCTNCDSYQKHAPARAARLIRQAAALGLTE